MEFRVMDQRWFITTPLSDSQAEAICTISNDGSWKQSGASKFVISGIPSSKDYRISIRHHESGSVEHIIISYNEEDNSYTIEGEDSRCQSVVEILRNYVASRDYALEPLVGSFESKDTSYSSKPPLWSLLKSESAQTEKPLANTAVMQHPIDEQPLKTDLDINRTQEAKKERENNSNGATKSHGRERGCCCGACDSGDYYNNPGWLWRMCFCSLGLPACICFICYVGYSAQKEFFEKSCSCCCRKL